jgi:hypothetical protein
VATDAKRPSSFSRHFARRSGLKIHFPVPRVPMRHAWALIWSFSTMRSELMNNTFYDHSYFPKGGTK